MLKKAAEYEEKLIVFSSITGGLSMGVGGDTCVVSLSNEITNDVDPQSLFISNALVIISENDSDTADTLFPVQNRPGRYLTKPDVVFKNGKTYSLDVTWNNFSVSSETTIPDSIKISSPNNEYYICDGEQLKVDSVETDNFNMDLLPPTVLAKRSFAPLRGAKRRPRRALHAMGGAGALARAPDARASWLLSRSGRVLNMQVGDRLGSRL